uniref:Uncharacterized protein n=1 Tax=Anguilla anguilla TaxID=7936 RepID=A0A0E9SAR5_ANGAN
MTAKRRRKRRFTLTRVNPQSPRSLQWTRPEGGVT